MAPYAVIGSHHVDPPVVWHKSFAVAHEHYLNRLKSSDVEGVALVQVLLSYPEVPSTTDERENS